MGVIACNVLSKYWNDPFKGFVNKFRHGLIFKPFLALYLHFGPSEKTTVLRNNRLEFKQCLLNAGRWGERALKE